MDRIFRLIDKAGGKAFILDKHSGKDYVVMSLDEYEDLVEEFCDEEFLDLGDDFEDDMPVEGAFDEPVDFGDPIDETEPASPEEDQFYIEPLE